MKLPPFLTSAGLAIAFALPTFAQEVSPQVRQAIQAEAQKFQDAYNARNIDALRALIPKDAIELRSWQGQATGNQISDRFAADFLGIHDRRMTNKIVALYPIGDAICAISDSDLEGWKAQVVSIYVNEGGVWKDKMTYVNNAIPAEPVTPARK